MSANFDDDIRQQLEVELSSAFPSTPIAWSNVDFSPPDELWIRPTIVIASEGSWAFNWDEIIGVFVCEIYTPRNQGMKLLYDSIDTLKNSFYRKKINELYIHRIMAVRELTEVEPYVGRAVDFEFCGYSNLYS